VGGSGRERREVWRKEMRKVSRKRGRKKGKGRTSVDVKAEKEKDDLFVDIRTSSNNKRLPRSGKREEKQ
jgi:hypothetical protein